MLVSGYALVLEKPKCNLYTEAIHAKGLLTEDVSPVMPYLNAAVPGCRYTPNAPAIAVPHAGRTVMVWPKEIALGACEGEADAREVLDGVCRLINEVWERRGSISPNHEGYQPLTPMEAYRLLPGTNCRECGQSTCLAFALRLLAGETPLEACRPLFDGAHGAQQAALAARL